MYYTICFGDYDSSKEYYFTIENETRNGWCTLRCVAIKNNDEPVELYNPDIHKKGHYMGDLWRARSKTYRPFASDEIRKLITLYRPFGGEYNYPLRSCDNIE